MLSLPRYANVIAIKCAISSSGNNKPMSQCALTTKKNNNKNAFVNLYQTAMQY